MILVDTSSDSSVSIVTGPELEDLGITVRFPVRADTLLFSEAFRPALEFHRVPCGLVLRGKSGRGAELTTNHLIAAVKNASSSQNTEEFCNTLPRKITIMPKKGGKKFFLFSDM